MKFLIPLILIACTFSCRSTHHERTENVQTSLADTAHFARIYATTSDSTATFTWLAIDTLDVWLAQPDSAPALQNAMPHTAQLRASNLRLVRSENSLARTRQDSVHSQSQSFQCTTSQVSDERQAEASPLVTPTLIIWSIAGIALIIALLYIYLRFHYNK